MVKTVNLKVLPQWLENQESEQDTGEFLFILQRRALWT